MHKIATRTIEIIFESRALGMIGSCVDILGLLRGPDFAIVPYKETRCRLSRFVPSPPV
jgi:hypothetical protein